MDSRVVGVAIGGGVGCAVAVSAIIVVIVWRIKKVNLILSFG